MVRIDRTDLVRRLARVVVGAAVLRTADRKVAATASGIILELEGLDREVSRARRRDRAVVVRVVVAPRLVDVVVHAVPAARLDAVVDDLAVFAVAVVVHDEGIPVVRRARWEGRDGEKNHVETPHVRWIRKRSPPRVFQPWLARGSSVASKILYMHFWLSM